MNDNPLPRRRTLLDIRSRLTGDAFVAIEGRERAIVFGAGSMDVVPELLPERYRLFVGSTGARCAEALAGRAIGVHTIPQGRADELAGDLWRLDQVSTAVVAVGGGRVVDVAKAVAAATSADVIAIPTTYSGAEMTRIHRAARGSGSASTVRPGVVVHDPDVTGTQSRSAAAAGLANALMHALEAWMSPLAAPMHETAALEAISRVAQSVEHDLDHRYAEVRSLSGSAALLAGWALDATSLGEGHLLAQSLIRVSGAPHAQTYAALVPRMIEWWDERGVEVRQFDEAAGRSVLDLANALAEMAGTIDLGRLGVSSADVASAVEECGRRPELSLIRDPAELHLLRTRLQASL